MNKIVCLTVVVSFGLFSWKSNYTRIEDKNSNYITYYLKVYETDSLFLVKNYKLSYEILDNLFKKYEPINIMGYYEYGNYLALSYLTNNIDNLSNKVKYNYKKFGNIFITTQHGMSLKDSILKKSKIDSIDILNLKKQYFKKTNKILREKIEKMIVSDQDFRERESHDKIKIIDDKNRISIDV